jgi:hypothetical protein
MLPQATTGQPEISRCWSYQIGDECLRLEVFLIQVDARRKLALWGHDESHHPPNSALAGRIQAEFAALSNRGKAGGISLTGPPLIGHGTSEPDQMIASSEIESGSLEPTGPSRNTRNHNSASKVFSGCRCLCRWSRILRCVGRPIFTGTPGLGHLGQYQKVGLRFSKLLILMVRERGFEPPTPWSRTRFLDLLKSVEIE